jgi:hypothetical protein
VAGRGKDGPTASYGGSLGGAGHHTGSKGVKGRAAAVWLTGGAGAGALGAAEGRCRGEAVQGRAARVRRCRRSGRRLGEDAPAVAAVSSSSGSPPAPSPLLRCGDGGLEKGHGWLEFKRAARVLMRGAGARVRSRPGLLGVRAGTRGGIAARLGLGFAAQAVGVREKGARGGCAVLSRSGDRRARLAGDARERGRGEGRKEEKGRRAVGGERAGERAGVAAVGRKGKADGWDLPVSCPGWKEGKRSRRFAMVGWAGSRRLARVRGRKGEKGKCSWAWVAWAGGWWPIRGVKG